jgi:hypothetical protein
VPLRYAVDDLLIEVHDHEGNGGASSNAALQRQLRRRIRYYEQPEPVQIYLAVHRIDDSVYYKRLQPESYRMLKALSKHESLEAAIGIAFEKSSMREEERPMAVQQWFGNWAELGWFYKPTLRLLTQR